MQNVQHNEFLDLKNYSKFLNSLDVLKNKSTIAVSVSAGVDSMSLLDLSNKWAKKNKKNLVIISFDHNLRREAVDEVKYVETISNQMGWDHKTLKWEKPPTKNILEKARLARYKAISNFCKNQKIDVLLLGHHLDDLVETFFMRLLKKSRIDGLCPMNPSRKIFGITFIRPFLSTFKKDLYSYARLNNIKFFEDPTNVNNKFLRTKIRMCLENDNSLKLNLIKSVNLFCKIRTYFEKHTLDFFLNSVVIKKEGYIVIEREKLVKLPVFFIQKILIRGVSAIGNKKYPLRSKALTKLTEIIINKKNTKMTVGGCLVESKKNIISIIREFNDIKKLSFELRPGKDILWDNKFLISNKSKNTSLFVNTLGKELENLNFFKFYISKKEIFKKLSFNLKKTLPIIKTLEGFVYIPHLNVYNNLHLKDIVKIVTIDYCIKHK